ncbi:hypothetical protein JCM3765_003957 [Sporobolomyces pararoseus]
MQKNTSYLPLSNLPPSKEEEDSGSTPSTPYPRRPSTFPLLHSRRTSDSSTFLSETESWIKLRQDRLPKRKIIAYSSLFLFVLASILLWVVGASQQHRGGKGGVTSWAMSMMGKKQTPFLLLRPNKRFPTPARRVLTNPLEPSKRLQYDVTLTLDSLPRHIKARVPTSLVIRCAHADLEQCAKSYRVLFVGPTIRSTLYSDSEVVDSRHVKVTFRIDDPGDYQIYAWPEFELCDFWSNPEWWTGPVFYKLAVGGTPFGVTVEGEPPKEGSRPCTLEDDLNGRWVSKSYLAPETLEIESPFYDWVQTQLNPSPAPEVDAYPPVRLLDYKKFGYVYTPYQCKIPHRNAFEWIDEVKPESILVIGDAITRDYFCLNWGVKDQDVCRVVPIDPEVDYKTTDKRTNYTRSDGGRTDLYFHWNPVGWEDGLSNFLRNLPSRPTHVFFAETLWITRENPTPEHYIDTVKPFLHKMVKLLPEAKIITRTSSSSVQQLGCWELANITRPVLEPVNNVYLKLLRKDFPSIKVIDAYPIYNDRPESSPDGARWERQPISTHARPEEGATAHALTDLIFQTWKLQG